MEAVDLQFDGLSSERVGARSQRVDTEARSSAPGTASPLLADLQTQEITLQRRIAELSALYGQGHPDMLNAKAQLAEVQRQVADEAARVGASLRTESAIRRDREDQLSRDIGALRADSFEKGMASVALMDLERDAEIGRASCRERVCQKGWN